MRITRAMCRALPPANAPPRFDFSPLQVGLGKDVWRVCVASMLLCRTRRSQMEPVLKALFEEWPTAGHLSRAGVALEMVVRPCGLHRNRARQLTRFSSMYLGDGWEELGELPGVGLYVHDCAGVFVFSDTSPDSDDAAVVSYAAQLAAASKASVGG